MSEYLFEMEAGFLAKWIDDLENGGHAQAKGRLYDGDGYCCIGRACKIAGASDSDILGHGFVSELNGQEWGRILPSALVGPAVNHDMVRKYAVMNDNGKTFKEIAAAIRKEVRPI